MNNKVIKLRTLLKTGIIDKNVPNYFPAMLSIVCQSKIYSIKRKKTCRLSYKDMQTLELNIILPAIQYINWNSVHICLPMKMKKSMAVANNIDANMITFNDFFAYRIKEKDIARYGDNLQIVPINTTDIYQYSDAMLKQMPQKSLLYSKKMLPDI